MDLPVTFQEQDKMSTKPVASGCIPPKQVTDLDLPRKNIYIYRNLMSPAQLSIYIVTSASVIVTISARFSFMIGLCVCVSSSSFPSFSHPDTLFFFNPKYGHERRVKRKSIVSAVLNDVNKLYEDNFFHFIVLFRVASFSLSFLTFVKTKKGICGTKNQAKTKSPPCCAALVELLAAIIGSLEYLEEVKSTRSV